MRACVRVCVCVQILNGSFLRLKIIQLAQKQKQCKFGVELMI